MPAKSTWLLGLGTALAALGVALAVWAVSAYAFAAKTAHWPTTMGTVVQADPDTAAAVRFTDSRGAVHLMPLAAGDTDDLPVGAVIRVAYEVRPDGSVRSEFHVQPGARASALTVLALVALSAAGVSFWRSRAEGTAESDSGGPVNGLPEKVAR